MKKKNNRQKIAAWIIITLLILGLVVPSIVSLFL